jgi:hypothetical protein
MACDVWCMIHIYHLHCMSALTTATLPAPPSSVLHCLHYLRPCYTACTTFVRATLPAPPSSVLHCLPHLRPRYTACTTFVRATLPVPPSSVLHCLPPSLLVRSTCSLWSTLTPSISRCPISASTAADRIFGQVVVCSCVGTFSKHLLTRSRCHRPMDRVSPTACLQESESGARD